MMSFWITFLAFCVLVASFFVADGPPISGWTAYAPLSAIGPMRGPARDWSNVLGCFHRDLLRCFLAGFFEFHCNNA